MLKRAYGNDAMRKTAVYEWHKGKMGKWVRGKVMLEVFFDYDSVIHSEFIPEGQTVNKELYLEILKRLRDAIRRKRPQKRTTHDWFLLHDNAPPHRVLIVKKYLARHSVTTLDHPPYSPGLAPADFYLFPRAENEIERTPFCGFR
ncbi:hypothetical protein AVEN_219528-1 [Araneus ventricosus]|uniref:Mariner Mos1 transposase n=1 Tax=Araneus ventricosus TaxID=182803 RepID=A0A4Y2BMG0_ARAVE|nr:hypothetical protein AVEN_219528-1 [Araneus ventricosus]